MSKIRKASAISCAVLIGVSGGALAADYAGSVKETNIGSKVDPEWTLAGVGSFAGENQDDLLWRHQNGSLHVWIMANGNIAGKADIVGVLAQVWSIRAVGDVDDDGDDDIIWQDTIGQIHIWKMQAGQRVEGYNLSGPVPLDEWTLAAAGDVDADGDDDIIWHHKGGSAHVWRMEAGQRVDGYDVAGASQDDWLLAAAGDVDGDGDDDIIWRYKRDGRVHIWPMQGGQRVDGYDASAATSLEWHIKGSGDLDGDNIDDIVWQHNDGQVMYQKMGPKRKTLKLVDLFCAETTDAGEDEVYLNITVDGVTTRFPAGDGYVSINEDSDIERWNIGGEYTGKTITVEVREDDDTGDDDLLGTVTVSGATANGTSKAKLTDGDYTLTYGVEDAAANQSFTMAFASDPQFYYCDHKACARHSSEYDVRNLVNDKVTAETLSDAEDIKANQKTNELHSQSIEALAGASANFKGVIVNGDLTNTMEDDQLDDFRKYYQNKFTVYPGLGNHDYANYTPYGDSSIWCGGPGIAIAKHYCLQEMMDYLAERVRALPSVVELDLKDTDDDGDDSWYHTGSWSYYWDIGDYRFIQLNNHPAYKMNFSVYRSDKVGSYDYTITQSLDWLNGVLAKSIGKKVILNMHGINTGDSFFDQRTDNKYDAEYDRFKGMLGANPNVIAIFAGHIHHWIGTKEVVDHDNDSDRASALAQMSQNAWAKIDRAGGATGSVPIFFSGSAMFNLYLKVDFEPNLMKVQVIDSAAGTAVPVGTPQLVRH